MTDTLANRDPRVGDCLSVCGLVVWVGYEGADVDPEVEHLDSQKRIEIWDCSTVTREILLTKDPHTPERQWTFIRPVGGLAIPEGPSLETSRLTIHADAPHAVMHDHRRFELTDSRIDSVPLHLRITVMVPQATWAYRCAATGESLDIKIIDGIVPSIHLTSPLDGKEIKILRTRRRPPHRPWRGGLRGLDYPVGFSKLQVVLSLLLIAGLLTFIGSQSRLFLILAVCALVVGVPLVILHVVFWSLERGSR